MAGTKELFKSMHTLWTELEENHTMFADKGNKAAGTRARKAAGEFKKIVTDYRKASVSESK
tara:strand:- start:198 stop:380 length:183 start_codon:yes stop_codon:yes gene_type:complete